jgi:hypothetical protein
VQRGLVDQWPAQDRLTVGFLIVMLSNQADQWSSRWPFSRMW